MLFTVINPLGDIFKSPKTTTTSTVLLDQPIFVKIIISKIKIMMKAYQFISNKCIYEVMYQFLASIYNFNFYYDFFIHKISLFGDAAAILGHFRILGVLRKNHYWIYQIIKHVYKFISLNFTFKLPPRIMNLATL